ncbi:MAG TPA: 4Fe-4S binding protein [Spirochaetota bacterium]|nr:4Fe-4S binding protein [Spirochaetota bacterium]HOM39104.1 4Fe-4S binding protein [Spirochaetota bacterium]HPQ49597.1 4Fe-4S binding protein [Spirochaetota bacterium]
MRKYFQLLSTIFFNLPFLSNIFKYIPAPVLNCYSCPLASWACPIGIIQHFGIIKEFPFFTIGLIIIFGLILARGFCSFLCPFGFFQDLIYKIPVRKIKLRSNLKYVQYSILIFAVLLIPILNNIPIFCYICPAGTLEASIPTVIIEKYNSYNNQFFDSFILESLGWIFYTKILILLTFTTVSAITPRPFCKICPLGLILSFFNKISILNFFKPKLKCKTCNNCLNKCALK